jgi:hypothetical protein
VDSLLATVEDALELAQRIAAVDTPDGARPLGPRLGQLTVDVQIRELMHSLEGADLVYWIPLSPAAP